MTVLVAHETTGGGTGEQVAKQPEREGQAGDFRNPQRVRAWARGVAAEIQTPTHGADRP